jgi:D-galactarolactone cycloisomerase
MNITTVTAIPLSATWKKVFGSADAVPHGLRHPAAHFMNVPRNGQYSTVVTITAEDGTRGIGEAWGLPLASVTATIVNDFLAPLLIGRDIAEHADIWQMLFEYCERLGHTRGFMMEALSGLDIALWDLRARLAGKPLRELLGTPRRDRVETYVSPVPFKQTPRESAEAARAFIAQGFRAMKIKAGRDIETDAAHIACVREAVGPDVELMVDVNGGYDAATAIAFAEKIAPLRIAWIEEPIPPERTNELAKVRRASAIPIAAGENEFTARAFADLLDRGAVDVIQPNVTRAGGITGVLEIAELARAHGATVPCTVSAPA